MSLLPKQNYRFNREIPLPAGLIHGQSLGAVSGMKFGLSNMSRSGCEVIAVYNALLLHHRPAAFLEIARYMERFRVLLGFFGCNAYRIGKALKHFGVEFRRTKAPDKAKAFIITFWTKKPFLSTIHTVFCVKQWNGILVYNRYNSCTSEELCRNLEEVAGKRRPIAVYEIVESGEGSRL